MQIDATSIRVADDEVVALDELGRVPAGETSTPREPLIPALRESLAVARNGSAAPSSLVVSAAASVPFGTFAKVLYSANAAGWTSPTVQLSKTASESEGVVTIDPEQTGVAPRAAPLEIAVDVGIEGFWVQSKGARLPAMSPCPSTRATICARDPAVDMTALSEAATRAATNGQLERADESLTQVVDAYDFEGLFRVLQAEAESYPEVNTIMVTAHPETPVAVLAKLAAVVQERFDHIVFFVVR